MILILPRSLDQAARRMTSTAYRLHIETETILPQIEKSRLVDHFLLALIHYFRVWLRHDAVSTKLDQFCRQLDEAKSFHAGDQMEIDASVQIKLQDLRQQIIHYKATLQAHMANLSQRVITSAFSF